MAARGRFGGGHGGAGYDILAALRGSRLLAAFLLAGPLFALYLAANGYGSRLLVASVASLATLALYAITITILPAPSPRPLPVRRPRLESAVLVGLALLILGRGLVRLGEVELGLLGQWLARSDDIVLAAAHTVLAPLALRGLEAARWQTVLADCVWLLALPGGVFFALGYRPADLGWRLGGWWLAAPLIAIGAWPTLAPLASGGGVDWPTLSPSVLAAGLVGGLATEFFWRALLFTRLEALGYGTPAALVGAALLAALALLPARLAAEGFDLVLGTAGLVMGTNVLWSLALGCLWLRARSLAPGVLWHASPWSAFPFSPGP
ncbi:MAG: CPBP family glutamic-type intramembrane protease [Chloroflexota bacterium]